MKSLISTLIAMTFIGTASLATPLEDVQSQQAYHRAKEAVFWSQGAMGVALSLDAIRKLGGDYNDIGYLSDQANWKYQILTPNSVSLYVESVIKTSQFTPVVVELPPVTQRTDIFGTIMDSFQTPLTDVGSKGADAGLGGKYIILPASYQGTVPNGYIPVHTERNISFFNFRVIPASFSDNDMNEARGMIQNINVYPYNDPDRKGMHIDVFDHPYQNVDPRDATYFDILAELLNEETVVERDQMMAVNLCGCAFEAVLPASVSNPVAASQ
ncbi:DUF1254 domain-containing protein [Parasedimentitalea psychrophila]|uniref:DUF1254 domain-containing protein n=1 Tax=Parasedimentitalea psychrophila TaxID=2997337 RepID=A0A9Y2P5X7_9RHOB|nr:DUF1254 domain-containing protein [Parasedimentitalea psychrophila]WIY24423.1 DUF1254 domain-containing protein [Parasedimentitalea psychrophila]